MNWRPSVSALYGIVLIDRASEGPGGIHGPEIEDVENTLDND